ncbi:MAG: hypothetical protein ACE5WD_11460 [Candidatus Aminicenantia bacterium]
MEKSKPIVIISAVIGLLILLIKLWIPFFRGEESEFGTIKPQDIGVTIEIGGYGTILGYILISYRWIFKRKR